MEEIEIRSNTNKTFDFFVLVDYHLQGKRQNIFLWCSFIIVLIAPIIDHIILPRRFSLASMATYFFLIFLFISTMAWVGKFRDEKGSWSVTRAISRAKLSWRIFIAMLNGIRGKNQSSRNFTLAVYSFVAGFALKALQITSEAIRHPLEYFKGSQAGFWRTFEGHNHTFLSYTFAVLPYLLVIIGVSILTYLHRKYPDTFNLFEVFIKGKVKPYEIRLNVNSDLSIINSNDNEKISNLAASNPDIVFKNTIKHLGEWKPTKKQFEADYELDLLEFMEGRLRELGLTVANQYKVKSDNEIGIVDVVVNESLFLELKRKVTNKELENAQGQILKYKRIIKNYNRPLILLLIDNPFETVRNKFETFIHEHNKQNSQKIIVIVVETE